MYSGKIQELLKKKSVQIGDNVKVSVDGKDYSGLVMPRIELGNRNCLVLKLGNGYNVGLNIDDKAKIEKIKADKKEKPARPTELKFNKDKPKVSLIVTGVTIGSKVEYNTGGVAALMNPAELLELAPELADFVNMQDIIRPFTKMSEDVSHEDWQNLAEIAAKELNKGNEGAIITHGTDALHITSAALSFMLKDLNKPVVITGSQRSSDRGSTDAAMNLLCSSYVAGYSDFAEVGVCMHGTINDDFCLLTRGTSVRKMHTSRRDAFRPINELPLAMVWPEGKIETTNKNYRRKGDGKVSVDTKFEPKVAILKAYPGSNPELIEYLIGKGYKGFVVEGMGLGHVPTHGKMPWIPAIKKAIADGIPIVITSQAMYGRTDTKVYENLRILFHEAKAISAEGMLSEVAYVKLGWALGHTTDFDEVRKIMLTNVAGEIPERVLPETFLY